MCALLEVSPVQTKETGSMAEKTLSYFEAGKGLPLVLLHPIGLDKYFWEPVFERFMKSRRVIALDLPGHGASPSVSAFGKMANYVSMVDQTLTALEVESADILGVSFGGMIAQELAILRPERVRRLVLCACSSAIPVEAQKVVQARGVDAVNSGMESIIESTLMRWFTGSYMENPDVECVAERLRKNAPQNWNSGWHAISEHNAKDRLAQLDLPALVVVGDKDLGTSVETARQLAAAIPSAKLEVIPNCPHMLHIEGSEKFVDIVSRFLLAPDGKIQENPMEMELR